MESALAMILAGGRGRRMEILCHRRAKPALPFAGTDRVIDFTIRNCVYSGFRNIFILTDYQRSFMASYINQWSEVCGESLNCNVLEPKNGSYLGTADAVYQNLESLEKDDNTLVTVLAGDHVYRMDYQNMLAFHKEMEADVTVGVIPVPIEQANQFGIVQTDKNERIIDFVEKPKNAQSDLVSMGIYVFNKQVLMNRLIEDAVSPYSPHDFGHAVIPRMVKRDRAVAYRFNGYWKDIGTPQAYFNANMELLYAKSLFNLNSMWSNYFVNNRFSPASKSQNGSIENSLISPGCVIKGRVKNSIFSPGVRVEEETEVINSIVMANSYIGYHSVIDHCILDENVSVGEFCSIGCADNCIANSSEVTILGSDVKVPPNTVIRCNCRIAPDVSHEDFTRKVLPSYNILSPGHIPELLHT